MRIPHLVACLDRFPQTRPWESDGKAKKSFGHEQVVVTEGCPLFFCRQVRPYEHRLARQQVKIAKLIKVKEEDKYKTRIGKKQTASDLRRCHNAKTQPYGE